MIHSFLAQQEQEEDCMLPRETLESLCELWKWECNLNANKPQENKLPVAKKTNLFPSLIATFRRECSVPSKHRENTMIEMFSQVNPGILGWNIEKNIKKICMFLHACMLVKAWNIKINVVVVFPLVLGPKLKRFCLLFVRCLAWSLMICVVWFSNHIGKGPTTGKDTLTIINTAKMNIQTERGTGSGIEHCNFFFFFWTFNLGTEKKIKRESCKSLNLGPIQCTKQSFPVQTMSHIKIYWFQSWWA